MKFLQINNMREQTEMVLMFLKMTSKFDRNVKSIELEGIRGKERCEG